MNADMPPPASSSTPTEAAIQAVEENLGTLRALLRLIDPASPFQPILLSSIDLVAWLALFGRAAERLRKALGEIADARRRNTARDAYSTFLRIADTLCQSADIHAFPSDATQLENVPDIADCSPDSAICVDDRETIASANARAAVALNACDDQRQLLLRSLSLAAANLKKKLAGTGGLLRLMKRHCRSSRPFARNYATLAANLQADLSALPDPDTTPWGRCRFRFSAVHYRLTNDILPNLGPLITDPSQSRSSSSAERLKTTTLREATAFIEALTLTHSLDARLQANRYHTLFGDLLTAAEAALARGDSSGSSPVTASRLIDDIRCLSHTVIRRDLITTWQRVFTETDAYPTDVVLAAIDLLERPKEDSAGLTTWDRWMFGISSEDVATRLRRGNFAGANPAGEISRTKAAEVKRVARTLEHLRRSGAAFHDRRQWTPAYRGSIHSTQHRLWTVNPLLVLLPCILSRISRGTPPTVDAATADSPRTRSLPTRRNRGTRTRRKG